MKHNATPQDVEALTFKRLTLVVNDPKSARKFMPVNPEATIEAVKAGEVVADESLATRIADAIKAAFTGKKADAPSGDDAVTEMLEDIEDQTVRSALYSVAYGLFDGISSIMHAEAFSDEHKQEAISTLIADSGVKMVTLASQLYGGKAVEMAAAVKAGARHSKKDLADLQRAHDHLSEAHDAIGKAKEHTAALLGDETAVNHDDAGSGDGAGSPGEKGTEVTDVTEETLKKMIDSAIKAALAPPTTTPQPAVQEPTVDVAGIAAKAAEAAVAALQPQLDALKGAIENQGTTQQVEIDAAKAALATAEADARKARETFDAAVKASRDRQTPGGHNDALQGVDGQASKSAQERFDEAKPTTLADSIALLLH